ncbi:DNA independent RNA polymerase I transcription factor [Cryptotrichosporon argae]
MPPFPAAAPSADVPAGRSTSLMGKKRPRESDGDATRARARRTKSTGDARADRERESFQRGLIGVFVPRALQESLAGRSGNFDDLVAHFLPTPSQPAVPLAPTLPLLRALTAHASLVDPDRHAPLVAAIVALPWATGDDRFVKTYVGWAGVLVSAHPGLAKQVVGMAIKGLTWQRKMPCAQPVSRRTYYARHHLLLSHLLSLIPTLPNVLLSFINKSFPRKREPEIAHAAWVRNCCELIDYCPEVGARVWGAVVDRMLRIDVEITQRVEDDDDEDETEDDDDDASSIVGPSRTRGRSPDPFDLLVSEDVPQPADDESDSDDELDFDDLSSADGSDGEDAPAGAGSGGAKLSAAEQAVQRRQRRAVLRDMRAKLDGMLVHFLAHLEESMGAREHASAPELAAADLLALPRSGTSTPTSEYLPRTPTPTPTTFTLAAAAAAPAPSLYPRRPASREQSLSHFQSLLNVFTRQILPTASTQHVPFVLFLASSFSPQHTDLFLGVLVSQALYATTAHATPGAAAHAAVSMPQRTAAVVYIGSLVCRARYVSDDQARAVMTYLLAFLDGALRTRQTRDELPLFYAVCQAAMLIFCFRHRAFGGDAADDDGAIVGELDLDDPADADADAEPHARRWMKDLDALQRAITSDLNPLLGCNADIVQSFAKVAHQTNFAYCFSIIEANEQRARAHPPAPPLSSAASTRSLASLADPAPATATATGAGSFPARSFARTASAPALMLAAPRAARQVNIDAGLDSYFPFDPYDLPRSARFVEPLYRTWQEVAVGGESEMDSDSDDDDDDASSDGSDSDSDNDTDDGMRIPTSRSLPKPTKIGSFGERRRQMLRDGGLSSSLENMSISPNVSGLAGR